MHFASEREKISYLDTKGKLAYILHYYWLWILGIGGGIFMLFYILFHAFFAVKDYWFYGIYANTMADAGNGSALWHDFVIYAGYNPKVKKVEMNDKIIQLIKKNVQIQFILLYLQNKAVGLIFTFVEHSLFLIIMAAQKMKLTNAYRRDLREKILATAIESFQENGIKAVKMDDIANRLSISKRTLYEIYGNKEDLLYECVCYHDKHFEKELQSRLSPKSSVMDILICFMRLHIEENSRTNPSE